MGIHDRCQVDALGIDKESGEVIASIIDTDDGGQVEQHLDLLREKIEEYFSFIANGEIGRTYPKSNGRKVVIEVVFIQEPIDPVLELLARADETAGEIGVRVRYRMHKPNARS